MRMHYMIRGIAGTFVLGSLALGYWVSPWFYLFTAFVGANLLQSSVTHWCLMENILEAAGFVEPDRSEEPAQHRARSDVGLQAPR